MKTSRTKFLLAGALAFIATGCTPTQPIYLNDTGDLSTYIEQATSIEYPDVDVRSLDEVEQAHAPITVADPDFQNYEDMTLEQAVGYALQNGKVFRGFGTASLQGTRVSPGVDNLVNGIAGAGTIYDVAIRETEPGFIGTPGQIAAPGSISTNTALDVNQGVEAALADFDAQFTSNLTFNKSDEPRNTVIQVDPTDLFNPNVPLIFQQDQAQWTNELSKRTANGTQLFFRNVSSYTKNSNPLGTDIPAGFQALESVYRTAFEAEVRQPLLRGRGAFINRMPIVISRISTDQQIANLEAQLQNLVTNVEVRYWDLYLAYRSMDAAKTGRDAAIETWRIVKDQYDEGSNVNIQQLAQAAEQYHFFDAQVIDAYNSVLNAEGALRFLMGWSSTDGRIVRPIDEPVLAPVEFDWFTTKCEALTYRPELRQERWEIKKRELALAHSKNGLLPELNVSSTFRWVGNGNNFAVSDTSDSFPQVNSGALNNLYDGNFQELALTAEYRTPIGFRRELSNVRNAQLKLAREIARLEDAELEVIKELSEAFRALEANQAIMQSSYNRWKETTIEKDHFKELEEEGVETLDVALDAQRRRSQAEIAFYTAVAEYNKVICLMHRRKGTTLPHSGIAFSEGAWPGKAYQDAHEYARRRGASTRLDYGWSRPNVISRGEDFPTDQNPGNVIHIDEGFSGQGQPFYQDGQPIYQDGQPIYSDPYVTPGEVIEPYNLTPSAPRSIPSGAYQGSQSRNAVPKGKKVYQARQVSYEEDVRADARHKRSSTKKGSQRSARSTKVASESIAAPKRDTSRAPMKRLRARTPKKPTGTRLNSSVSRGDVSRSKERVANESKNVRKASATTEVPIQKPSLNYNSKRTRSVAGTSVNWQKMGFEDTPDDSRLSGATRATIRRN